MADLAATKRALAAIAAQNKLQGGGAGGISPADFKAQLAKYRAQPPKKPSEWDKFLRVGTQALNSLGSLGYGAENALYKQIDLADDMKKKFERGDILGGIGDLAVSPFALGVNAVEGFTKANTGKANELHTGSDIIEHATDFIGKNHDKNYVDREDNVNPWVKGIGGFGVDVFADPLTYTPAGIPTALVKGAAKGAVVAAKAAKGGDIAKTLAAGKSLITPAKLSNGARVPVTQGGIEELGKWAIKRSADKDAKAQIKTAKAKLKAGTATDDEAAWFVGAAPKQAAKVIPPEKLATILAEKTAAKVDDVPVREAAPDLADIVDQLPKTPKGKGKAAAPASKIEVAPEAAAPPVTPDAPMPDLSPVEIKAAEEAGDLAELSTRARAAARTGDDYAAGVAAMPVQKTDILATMRRLSYEKNLHSQKVAQNIRGLRPRPMGVAGMDAEGRKALNKAQSEWGTHVEAVFRDKGATQKILRQIKDPTEFRDTVKKLAAEKVQATYADAEPAQIFKGLAAKSRQHNEEQLAAFAKQLGLDKRRWGKKDDIVSWGDFFRKKTNIKADFFDKVALAEKQNATLFHGLGLPDGDVIETVAAKMTPEAAKGQAATDFARVLDSATPEQQARFMAAFTASGQKAFGIGEKTLRTKGGKPRHEWLDRQGETVISNLTKKAALAREDIPGGALFIKSHILEQYKTYSFTAKLLSAASSEATRLGLKGVAREDFLYDDLLKGAEFHDSYYRSLGVTAVTGRHAQEGTRFKNAGSEWAFLGFSDVLKALPKPVVQGLLLAGKDHSLAPTLLHNMARWALKLGGTADMSDGDKIATIMRDIQKATDDLADSASKKFMATPDGQARTIAAINALLSPEGMASLTKANIRNGAFARTIVGEQAHRMSDEAVRLVTLALNNADGTVGSDIDAVLGAMKTFRDTVKREGMSASDAAVVGQFDLERVIAQNMDIGTAKTIRAGIRMRSAQTAGKTDEQLKAAEQAVAEATGGLHANGTPKLPKGRVKTVGQLKEAAATKAAGNTARADQVSAIAPEIEEYMNRVVDPDLASGAEKLADLDTLRAQATMGLPGWMATAYRFGVAMSGGFGYRNLHATEIQFAISTRNAANQLSRAIGKFSEQHGRETTDGAWAVLRRMESNDGLEAALEGVDEVTAAAARQLWPMMKLVFDHSDHNLFARLGFDADYLNKFLRKVGVDQDYWLVPGREGHEVGKQWKSWEFDADHDPMQLLALYHKAVQQATVVPGIAASFSAEFGHRSNWLAKAMTDEEARAAGWQKVVKKEDSLSEFLDPEQYYDPKMLSELSMLDSYLSKSVILNEDKVFDKVFRHLDHIINAMKASVTVWRPGHHVTNVTGEALFNTLAGVWNPARYGDAFRVLASQGLVEGKSGDAIFDTLQKLAPEGFELRQTDLGKGALMTIGGRTRSISYDSIFKLLDKAGVVLHASVAEDFLTESAERLGRNMASPLAPVSKVLAPNWLAAASANRDNVFRITHALDILSKHSYRNVDEAMKKVAAEVHSYHPTMQTMSAVEQKYIRRYIYFYTWQRQALSRVVESMIETPGRVMVAPKAIYNLAEANGIEAQSFGEPMPNDPRLPDYSQGTINSALWLGAPGGTEGMPADHIWGADINAPQLDILQQVFGAIKINPDKPVGEQITDSIGQFGTNAILANLTPLLKAPAELGTRHKFGTGGEIRNVPEYLADQTGLRVPSVLGAFGERSDAPKTEQERKAQAERTIANWFIGAKITDYTTPKAARGAALQRREELKRMLEAKK